MTIAPVWRCPVCHAPVESRTPAQVHGGPSAGAPPASSSPGPAPIATPIGVPASVATPIEMPAKPSAWVCAAGHSFDVAREGYVNLLVTHQRRARPPGDSPAMLRDRRAFLDAGWYRPLAEALEAAAGLDREPGRPGDRVAVLDAGCGEGYYTRHWPARGATVWGVDIAKEAVRMAARRGGPGTSYAVGSVYDLPVLDASVDVVVSVFAPIRSAELSRVLRPGGLLVTAGPGPDHLDGLKRLLFATPEPHSGAGPLDGATGDDAGGDGSGFRREGLDRLRYPVTLDRPEHIAHLLGMIPYGWYVDPSTRAAVSSLPSLETTIDFTVARYRREGFPER